MHFNIQILSILLHTLTIHGITAMYFTYKIHKNNSFEINEVKLVYESGSKKNRKIKEIILYGTLLL